MDYYRYLRNLITLGILQLFTLLTWIITGYFFIGKRIVQHGSAEIARTENSGTPEMGVWKSRGRKTRGQIYGTGKREDGKREDNCGVLENAGKILATTYKYRPILNLDELMN